MSSNPVATKTNWSSSVTLRPLCTFHFLHTNEMSRPPLPSLATDFPRLLSVNPASSSLGGRRESSRSPPAIWKRSYLHKNKQTSFPLQEQRIVCRLPNLGQKPSHCCRLRPVRVFRSPQGRKSAHSLSRDSPAAACVKNNTSELWLHLLYRSNEPVLLAAFRGEESCHHSLAHQFGDFQTCTHSLLPITSSA